MSDMGEGDGRARIARAVQWAIDELAISKTRLADEAGVDFRTLQRLLDGDNVRAAQKSKLARYLGWPGNAFDLIADGEDPPPLPASLQPRSIEERVNALESRFERIDAAVRRIEKRLRGPS